MNGRAPAQAFVEYALIAAVVVISFLVGLSALSGAASSYLAHTEPTPPPAVIGSLPNHLVSISVSCVAPPLVLTGHQFTCTVTVKDLTSPGPTQTPAGTVAFVSSHGSVVPSPCRLNGSGGTSTCTLQYTPVNTGVQDLTATYQPTSAHVPAVAQLPPVISAVDQTQLILRCPTSPVPVGEPGQCTATMTDLYPGRFGPINISPGLLINISAGTGTFSAVGALSPQTPDASSCTTVASACSLLFRSNPIAAEAGQRHTLTATFAGDQDFDAATGTDTFTVGGVPAHPATLTMGCSTGTQQSSPLQVNLNGSTTCTATVTDNAPNPNEITPTGTVWWMYTPDYGSGNFSSPSCDLVKVDDLSAHCQVTYTPTSVGDPPGPTYIATHQITATYSPDFIHIQGSGTASTPVYVTDQHPVTVQVACKPPLPTATQPMLLGGPTAPSIDCTAWVIDMATLGTPVTPTGQITWTPTYGGSGGSGSISGLPCNLRTFDSKTANCSITYLPIAVGNPAPPGPVNTHTLTATYSGDGLHPAVSPSDTDSATLYVANQHAVSVSQPNCLPQTNPLHVVGPPVTTASCTVTVTDPGPSPVTPTGTITWSMSPGPNGGAGSFSPSAQCTLQGSGSTVQCAASVTYTPTAVGIADPNTHNIVATYSGDGFHPTAQGTPASVAVTN
jgi:hypothetical protein